MEGKSNLDISEKHIEAAIQSLKDGDSNGAITHAQGAKASINTK
jgi:hypothetical protein